MLHQDRRNEDARGFFFTPSYNTKDINLLEKSIYELLFHGAGGQRQICPGDHAPKETASNDIGPKDVGKIGFPTKDLSVVPDR